MTSGLLPSCRRISSQASVEPTASPSARACEVSTKCSRLSISFSTWSIIGAASLLLFCPLKQLVNPRAQFFRTVQLEENLWSAPQVQPVGDFVTNKPGSRRKPLQAALALLVAPLHGHQNSRRTAVFRKFHRRDGSQTNSRISQLPFHHGFDLFPQGLSQALPMIFRTALLHIAPRTAPVEIKRMRISEIAVNGL